MEIQPLEILKWTGIVLAAGFVGYFGRYLAMVIIDRLHKKRPEAGAVEGAATKDIGQQINMTGDISHKIEKKQAKAAAKTVKKAGRL